MTMAAYLQISLTNLIIVSILLLNFSYLQSSNKLNSKIFFWIMVTTVFMIILELLLKIWPESGLWLIDIRMIRALFFCLIPFYPSLAALYSDTWMYENTHYTNKTIVLFSLPILFIFIDITLWYFSTIESSAEALIQSVYGQIYVVLVLFPLLVIWGKMIIFWKSYDKRAIIELLIISIPVVFGAFFELFFPEIMTFWTGAVISQVLGYFYLLSGHAMKDALTQIGNRRALSKDERKLFQSSKHFIGGILIDIDHFKTINDNYGHQIGDDILNEVVQLLQQSTFMKDGLYRLGGDEFLILLNLDHKKDIELIVNRLSENLTLFNREKKYAFNLSLSLGMQVTSLSSMVKLSTFIDDLDQRMYEAKKSKKT